MRLAIGLLGPFTASLDGQPITEFESVKVRALLAYLAAEYARPHRREILATLLWPDWPQQSAMRNLRNALADLRKNIGDREAQPPFLLVSRDSLQLNREADVQVDVAVFESVISQPRSSIIDSQSAINNLQSSIQNQQSAINHLKSAIALYRGSFLEGFSLADSPAFEQWVLQAREQLSRQVLKALSTLVDFHERQGECEQALSYAYREVELEPWREEAHQQLMRSLASSGERSAALAQFEKCRQILADELGVAPGAETIAVYEQIRDGKSGLETKPLVSDSPQISGFTRVESSSLPAGTVTFLFTDIEGSVSLWERGADLMADSLQLHNMVLRQAIQTNGGIVFKVVGDAFQAVFTTASQALKAAIEIQRGLLATRWNALGPLKARMGLHSGEAELNLQGDEYEVSPTKNRIARIMAAGHGGQILISRAVADLLAGKLPQGVTFKDMGEHYFKGLLHPEQIYQVVVPGLPADFPPLVSGDPHSNLRQYKPKSLTETLEIVDKVCAELENTHAAGVIYRDLKLENIIITPSGTVQLVDFGLARGREGPRLTEEGALMGTFLYMAPELLMGEAASIKSDLYALGVIFYELVCGQPPFKGDNPLALASQHLQATPVPPSTHNPALPLELESLILRLLAKKPGDRPASSAEVRLSLRTFTHPEQAAAPVTPAGGPLDRMVRGRLVGRERELLEALRAWRKVQQGESSILLISGEPGVGKSRLVRELTVQVQMEHGTPLAGECYAEGNAPYAAFAQMILNAPEWPTFLPQLVLADLVNLAPGLRVRYPGVPLNPPLEPMDEQQRLYESAFTFFAGLAKRTALLLVLEDVHWADGGTLALVRSLVRRFCQTQTPVLIVLTFREGELTEQKGLNDLLTSWNRERIASQIKLHCLDRQGTQDLLEALFAESVSDEFADGVYHETEGNPFFIEELCKALIDGGQVYRQAGRWQRRSTTPIELPRSIRLAIEARLASLPPSSQEVLHQAAVLGRRFEYDVLLDAAEVGTEQAEEALIAALEVAEQAQLLFEIGREGGGTFEFAHALIPATLVEGISGMRRRRLHRRVIDALERLHPQDYKTLAHHCLEAGQEQRALDYLIKASQRARETFANAEAVADYQQALGLIGELRHESILEKPSHAIALQLHEDLGDVLELTGQHEQAWTSYQSALSLVPASEGIRRSRLLRKSAKTRETLRLFDGADQVYRQAETALGPEPASNNAEWRQEWVSLQLDRLYSTYWSARVPEMLELVELVRPAVERYGSPIQRGKFYSNTALAMMGRDRYVISDEILALNRQALSILKEVGVGSDYIFAEFSLGFSLLWHGDLDEAEKQLLNSLQASERMGDVTIKTRVLTYLAITYRKRGDVPKVLEYAARSLEAAAIGQMIAYTLYAQANQAWAARREGKLDKARQLAVSAWETMQKTRTPLMFAWMPVWPLLAICLAEERVAEAVDYARILFGPMAQPQPEAIVAHLQAAIQAWDQGQPEEASTELAQAATLAEPLGYI